MTVKPFDQIVPTLHELIRRYPTCEGLIIDSWDTLYQACTEEQIVDDLFKAMDVSGLNIKDGPQRLVESLYNIFWVIHGETDEEFSSGGCKPDGPVIYQVYDGKIGIVRVCKGAAC